MKVLCGEFDQVDVRRRWSNSTLESVEALSTTMSSSRAVIDRARLSRHGAMTSCPLKFRTMREERT